MAEPATPFVNITESRVYRIPTTRGLMTVVLLHGDYIADSMVPHILLPVDGPVTLCRLPEHAWRVLWPQKPAPLPWLAVDVAPGHLVLKPNLARAHVGGLIAFLSEDPRIPINGKTKVTWFDADHDITEPVPSETAEVWTDLWSALEPRLPYPRLSTMSKRLFVTMDPYMYAPLTGSGAIKAAHNQVLGAYLGTGVGTAVLAGLFIVLLVRYRVNKA